MGSASHMPGPARTALLAWRERLGRGRAQASHALTAWAPGRINLIGEHTDYNDGWVLPAAVDKVVAVAGQATPEPYATLYSVHHGGYARFPCSPEALRGSPRRRLPLWAKFARATLAEMTLAGRWPGGGMEAAIAGDVPVGGGLSSSAALEVAYATFALGLTRGVMEPLDVARLCQRAEQRGARVRVGIMDQAASCLGQSGQAILLDCRTLAYTYTPAALPDMRWVVFDTGAPHTLATSGYNQRRAQCEEASRQLAALVAAREPARTISALRDVTEDDLDRYGARLDPVLARRARHVVAENVRTLGAAEALRNGNVVRFGALMDQSHASLRDLYEVSSVELDIAVEVARAVPGIFGARMMGAGFGGSILALAKADAVGALGEALAGTYPQRAGREGQVIPVHIGGGPATTGGIS